MDSIIFDLDGTLWDSTATLVAPWNEVFHEEGIDKTLTLKDLKGVMGFVIEDIADRFVPELDRPAQIALMKKCCQRETVYLNREGGVLYDGLEETLKLLQKDYKLFIVSNCENGYIEAFFHAHRLGGYFTDVEYIGRTGKSKGENIRLIIQRHNLKNPVYVGDTQKDKDASVQAGIPFIYASYGFGNVENYDAKLDCFSQLPEVLKKMQRK